MPAKREFVPHRRHDWALQAVFVKLPDDLRIGNSGDGRRHGARVEKIAERHSEALGPGLESRLAAAGNRPRRPVA